VETNRIITKENKSNIIKDEEWNRAKMINKRGGEKISIKRKI